jgi:hypothetical protein
MVRGGNPVGLLNLSDLAGHGDNVDLPRFSALPTFSNQGGQVVARYVDPSVVDRLVRSAFVEGRLQVPAPYAFDFGQQSAAFGPGVDPEAVFQAWQQAQEQAMPWYQESAPQGYGGYGSYASYLFGLSGGGNAPVVVRARGGVSGCNCG